MNTLKCGHYQQRSRKSQRDLKFRGAVKILRLRAGQESSVNFNIRLTNLSFPFLVPEGLRISIRHYSTSLRRFVNEPLSRFTDETSNDTPSEFVPVKKYANAYTEKLKILQDNKNKAGVYR